MVVQWFYVGMPTISITEEMKVNLQGNVGEWTDQGEGARCVSSHRNSWEVTGGNDGVRNVVVSTLG